MARVGRQPRDVDEIELNGMIGSIAHLAYHLGAIRQINHVRARAGRWRVGKSGSQRSRKSRVEKSKGRRHDAESATRVGSRRGGALGRICGRGADARDWRRARAQPDSGDIGHGDQQRGAHQSRRDSRAACRRRAGRRPQLHTHDDMQYHLFIPTSDGMQFQRSPASRHRRPRGRRSSSKAARSTASPTLARPP